MTLLQRLKYPRNYRYHAGEDYARWDRFRNQVWRKLPPELRGKVDRELRREQARIIDLQVLLNTPPPPLTLPRLSRDLLKKIKDEPHELL